MESGPAAEGAAAPRSYDARGGPTLAVGFMPATARIYEHLLMYACAMSHGDSGRHATPAALDAATAREVAQIMDALSTPSRVRILARLRESPCSVGELAAAVTMEQSAVSHQLRVLRHLGLVVGERDGRRIVYALHDSHVGVLLEEAIYHVEHVRLGAIDHHDPEAPE